MTIAADRPLGRVLWHTTVSLDGYIADPAEEMDWVFELDHGQSVTAAACVTRLGALLVGRNTMRVEDRQRPGFYGGAFRGPFFVLTHDRKSPPPVVKGVTGAWTEGPIDDAVSAALDAANGADVGILGAQTAAQALDAGLIDEVIVQVAPVFLGDGIPLHRGGRHRLELLDTYRDGEITTLHFATARSSI